MARHGADLMPAAILVVADGHDHRDLRLRGRVGDVISHRSLNGAFNVPNRTAHMISVA